MLELLFELFFELVVELGVDLGARAGIKRLHGNTGPWISFFIYVFFGTLLGAMSVLLVGDLMFEEDWQLWLNLIVTPVLAGAAMAFLGNRLRSRGKKTIRLESFLYGYFFALAFVLMRVYLIV